LLAFLVFLILYMSCPQVLHLVSFSLFPPPFFGFFYFSPLVFPLLSSFSFPLSSWFFGLFPSLLGFVEPTGIMAEFPFTAI
jgi:hypothetical protein